LIPNQQIPAPIRRGLAQQIVSKMLSLIAD
jgi:hypothetical protein